MNYSCVLPPRRDPTKRIGYFHYGTRSFELLNRKLTGASRKRTETPSPIPGQAIPRTAPEIAADRRSLAKRILAVSTKNEQLLMAEVTVEKVDLLLREAQAQVEMGSLANEGVVKLAMEGFRLLRRTGGAIPEEVRERFALVEEGAWSNRKKVDSELAGVSEDLWQLLGEHRRENVMKRRDRRWWC